jgi:hypothetical protein
VRDTYQIPRWVIKTNPAGKLAEARVDGRPVLRVFRSLEAAKRAIMENAIKRNLNEPEGEAVEVTPDKFCDILERCIEANIRLYGYEDEVDVYASQEFLELGA